MSAPIAWNFFRILFGLYVCTAALLGYALAPLSIPWRMIYGVAGALIVLPPDPFGMTGYTINFVGIAAGIALLVMEHLRRKATTASATA